MNEYTTEPDTHQSLPRTCKHTQTRKHARTHARAQVRTHARTHAHTHTHTNLKTKSNNVRLKKKLLFRFLFCLFFVVILVFVCFVAPDVLTTICRLAIVSVCVIMILSIGDTQISILLLCFPYLFVELMITMNE